MRMNVIAAGLAASLMTSAAAQAAVATTSLNVRSGPSTSYRVVDTLRPGEQVSIRECISNGWCYVIKSGPDGWASGKYLSDRRSPSYDDDDEPQVDFNVRIPGFGFSIGTGGGFWDYPGTRPPRPDRNLVCLVTFERRSQVDAGRDQDVIRARLMSRAAAERRDRPNDRQRIFDYGSNAETRDTCRYLDRLN